MARALEKCHPMLVAHDRPACDVHQDLRAFERGQAEKLGETQVVADERGDLETLPFEEQDFIPGGVVLPSPPRLKGCIFW